MLIAMAIYDTTENQRTWMTAITLESLWNTVDWEHHRLFLIDNNSCEGTKRLLAFYAKRIKPCQLITLPENVGTANAINTAWGQRDAYEHVVKMDNDVSFLRGGWADKIEYLFEENPDIGQIGLKRSDLWESPGASPPFNSTLYYTKKPWTVLESVGHVMGTCVAHSKLLIDKVGYLWQPGIYAFDDSLMSYRSLKAKFVNCFLPEYPIDHVDPGGDAYTQWKRDYAGEKMAVFEDAKAKIMKGKWTYYDLFTGWR
jgi:hypothetical protein